MSGIRASAYVAALLSALAASVALSAPPRPTIADRLKGATPKPQPAQPAVNAMPSSFDVYPADPCAGMWTTKGPDKGGAGKIIVARVAGKPFVHVEFGNMRENFRPDVLGPHALEMRDDTGSVTMHCSLDLALIDLVFSDGDQTQHMALEATQ